MFYIGPMFHTSVLHWSNVSYIGPICHTLVLYVIHLLKIGAICHSLVLCVIHLGDDGLSEEELALEADKCVLHWSYV